MLTGYFEKYIFKNLSGALYRVDIVPGGRGSLHTILPNSFQSASVPSERKTCTEKKGNKTE